MYERTKARTDCFDNKDYKYFKDWTLFDSSTFNTVITNFGFKPLYVNLPKDSEENDVSFKNLIFFQTEPKLILTLTNHLWMFAELG